MLRGDFVLALCIALLACTQPKGVSYSGDVLVVDGKTYALQSRTGPFLPGHVIVVARKGRADELEEELKRFGLSAARSGKTVIQFVVAVPNGFELQWVEALRNVPSVAAAGEDRIYAPTA